MSKAWGVREKQNIAAGIQVLLECEAVSLGELSPTFQKNAMLSYSRVMYRSSWTT